MQSLYSEIVFSFQIPTVLCCLMMKLMVPVVVDYMLLTSHAMSLVSLRRPATLALHLSVVVHLLQPCVKLVRFNTQ